MGTNFYLRDRATREAKENMSNEINTLLDRYELSDDIVRLKSEISSVINNIYSDDIHIAKTSCGWKPIFQSHENKFSNMNELKDFYLDNIRNFEIIDEYNNVYTWEEFVERVLNFGKNGLDQTYAKRDSLGYFWTNEDFS